ncbi:unnamed protein product [Adineta steineri]|uniref:Uncharacterized protein n=1 Tax=Adineta steineri TaxID=433720 RepID=A0A819RQP5_9BILA|nr:unnamed protein product [Adineta steineri]
MLITMIDDDDDKVAVNFELFLTTCANTCPSSRTSDMTSTCGRTCITSSNVGNQNVGSTGTCYTNSTFCPGGIYTITRNTYSTVNFDCNGCCGCGSYGCCTGIGLSSSSDVYCVICN